MEQTRQEDLVEGHDDLVAVRIDEARDIRGLSVAELARRSMIDAARLGWLLRRERKMRASEVVRLCYVLEVGFPSLIPRELEGELARVNKRKARGTRKQR